MTGHPISPEELESYLQGTLTVHRQDELERHVGECPDCQETLTRLTDFDIPSRLCLESETVPEFLADLARRSAPQPGLARLKNIPGYRLEGELGRGGMGVVFKAYHLGLERVVALKMILPESLASQEALARFRREAQVIAQLRHPNIVQIFDIGELEGQPYFSLEYCPGGSLSKKIRAAPLSPLSAAALVEQLAGAIQAAHERGVLHRDLKPANVLLAEDGTPKVTDFGLAKRMKEAGQTQSGAIVGTPEYMAPEQARGRHQEVGPASDVYALGAILYECLTGKPPFQASNNVDTMLQVISADPVSPRQLQPTVPRDLETICLCCLHKEPGKRYSTARALAEDLRRFQRGEPIQARPAGLLERLRKWCWRHPAAASSLTVALLALLGLLVAGVLFTIHLNAARQQAADHAADEEKARKEAEARFELAFAVVEEMYGEFGYERFRDVPGLAPVRQAVLEKALRFHQRFLQERAGDPRVRQAVALSQLRIGEICHQLGKHELADAAYREALASTRELLRENPQSRLLRRQLAGIYRRHGELFAAMGRVTQAESAYGSARDLLLPLHQENLGHVEVLADLAGVERALGAILQVALRPRDAEKAFASARDRLRDRIQPGDAAVLRQEYALATRGLAVLYHRNAAALPHGLPGLTRLFNEGVALSDALVRDFPQVESYRRLAALTRMDLATWQANWFNLPGAQSNLRQAVILQRKLAAEQPAIPGYAHELAISLNNLANIHILRNQLDEALKLLDEALEIRLGLVARYPLEAAFASDLGCVQSSLAKCLEKKNQPEAARQRYDEAIATLEGVLRRQPNHREARTFLRNASAWRAAIYHQSGRHVEALADWNRALELDDGSMAWEYRPGREKTLRAALEQLLPALTSRPKWVRE